VLLLPLERGVIGLVKLPLPVQEVGLLVAAQLTVADFPVVIEIGLTLIETDGGLGKLTVSGILF